MRIIIESEKPVNLDDKDVLVQKLLELVTSHINEDADIECRIEGDETLNP